MKRILSFVIAFALVLSLVLGAAQTNLAEAATLTSKPRSAGGSSRLLLKKMATLQEPTKKASSKLSTRSIPTSKSISRRSTSLQVLKLL